MIAIENLYLNDLRSSAKLAGDPVRSDITIRTSILPELAQLIDQLSIDTGKTPVETIVLSLVMMEIITRAGKEGKRIAITDGDLNVEQEILIPGRPHVDA